MLLRHFQDSCRQSRVYAVPTGAPTTQTMFMTLALRLGRRPHYAKLSECIQCTARRRVDVLPVPAARASVHATLVVGRSRCVNEGDREW